MPLLVDTGGRCKGGAGAMSATAFRLPCRQSPESAKPGREIDCTEVRVPGHDELFKTLFQTFFPDLLALTVPELVDELRTGDVRFVHPELFTAPPDGERRQVDLAAEVRTCSGDPELVIVHVEIEVRAQSAMGQRMLEYAVLLRARRGLPVLPIVVFLRGGPQEGLRWCRAEERLATRTLLAVDYVAFSLSRSRAEEYLARPQRLAWALVALMESPWEPAEHRFRCIEPIYRAALTDRQRYLLHRCVWRYIELKDEQIASYEEMVMRENLAEVTDVERTWVDRLAVEGRDEGRLQEGRRLLLRQLEARFGPLDDAVRRRVDALHSAQEVERLFERALEKESLQEVGLGD